MKTLFRMNYLIKTHGYYTRHTVLEHDYKEQFGVELPKQENQLAPNIFELFNFFNTIDLIN